MKKIFLTGGNSILGKKLIETKPCEVYAPGRNELNLRDSEAVKNIDFTGFDTLIMLHRAGIGERYDFVDWPTEKLEYNLNVNVTNTMLLIQRWFQHTQKGTVFFMGTSDINEKCDYKLPYWTAKQMIINTLQSLRQTYSQCRIHTLNPASFEAKNKSIEDRKDIRTADNMADIVWDMIKNNIAHMDVWNEMQEEQYNQFDSFDAKWSEAYKDHV